MTLTAHIGYAYTPRQGARNTSSNHAVLNQPLKAGRLSRDQGDALCRPRRKFWGLEDALHEQSVTCPRCLDLAERYGVSLPTNHTCPKPFLGRRHRLAPHTPEGDQHDQGRSWTQCVVRSSQKGREVIHQKSCGLG